MIRFGTLPVFLQKCMMAAYFLLINLLLIHATKDLNLHRHIVKGNTLLSVLESKWTSFCSWAHSQLGLASIPCSLPLLYFPFAPFSNLFNANSSWTGLFLPQWCLEDCQCTPCEQEVQVSTTASGHLPSDSLLWRNVSYGDIWQPDQPDHLLQQNSIFCGHGASSGYCLPGLKQSIGHCFP